MTISIKIFRAYSTRRKKRVSEWICIVISFAFQFHCFYFSCSFCIIWTATFTYVEPNRSHRQTNEKFISRFILANEAEFYYRSLFLTTNKKKNKTKRNENIKCKEFCLSPVVRDSYILLFDLLETSGRGHAMLIHFPPCVWIVIQFSMEENQPIALWFFTLAWASYGIKMAYPPCRLSTAILPRRSAPSRHCTFYLCARNGGRPTKNKNYIFSPAVCMRNVQSVYTIFVISLLPFTFGYTNSTHTLSFLRAANRSLYMSV